LTNIAVVLKKHPELARNIRRVVMVAGRRAGQRFLTGNLVKKAHPDSNFEHDPAAMQWVLDSETEIVLLPFEVASQIWIDDEDLITFRQGSEAAKFMVGPSEAWLNFWQSTFGVSGFNPFDTIAVEYAVKPEMLDCEQRRAEIRTGPDDLFEKEGGNMKPYLFSIAPTSKRGRPVIYCRKALDSAKEDIVRRVLGNPTK
jgi:pyrimidine-specific ribonucleoside hydrolase